MIPSRRGERNSLQRRRDIDYASPIDEFYGERGLRNIHIPHAIGNLYVDRRRKPFEQPKEFLALAEVTAVYLELRDLLATTLREGFEFFR